MPYELRGNKVVKKGSGEVVKDHGDDHEKAVRHLRALKANVEEAWLCECGAPSLGPSRLVCQRGHRLLEAWSPEARAAALAARERNKPAGSFNVGDRVVHDAGGNTGVVAKKAKDAVHIAPDDPGSVDWDAIEHGSVGGKRTLLYGHDAPMSGFKPRPPQTLKLRGQ